LASGKTPMKLLIRSRVVPPVKLLGFFGIFGREYYSPLNPEANRLELDYDFGLLGADAPAIVRYNCPEHPMILPLDGFRWFNMMAPLEPKMSC